VGNTIDPGWGILVTLDSNSFVRQEFENDRNNPEKYKRYLKFISYFDLFGRDSLNESFFKNLMKKNRMETPSLIFDNELYKSFKRSLKPPTHVKEQGISITYSSDQKKIIDSYPNIRQKVKGVAGSGKTMCLAKRAVNAHKRHGDNVLILTYNISLRNYIRDKINEVREDFEWKYFHIIHYHEFFKSQANNHNIKISGLGAWDDENFFEDSKNNILKYKTVIIDEVQDYQKPWINLINKYFLAGDGEYVVFGDEKQNIYQRIYDVSEKKPYTKIGGAWNILKESYRISNDIARLAESFQKEFFSEKYEIDEMLVQRTLFENSNLKYFIFENFDEEKIISTYKSIANEYEIHDNDICFQATNVQCLRALDFNIRKASGQKTNTMFETQEVYDKLYNDFGLNGKSENNLRSSLLKKFKKEIDKVRRNKKFNFWNNPGLLKMSTVHSFKGWEVNTLFLLIDENLSTVYEMNDKGGLLKESEELTFTSEELIYTGITRCRNNLIIINFSQNKFHEFFIQQDFEAEYVQ